MDIEKKHKDFKKKYEHIKETSMNIARIPKQTKKRFVEVAKEEFENDYGMLLKWLLDFRDGIIGTPDQVIDEKINAIAQRVAEIEMLLSEASNEKEPEKLFRVSADGSRIETPEVVKNGKSK